MTITRYGLRNCDTMKKARARLDARGDAQRVGDVVGWETLLDRAGTTFRALAAADEADLDEAKRSR